MKNKYWKSQFNTAEQVIAHAECRRRRGKAPSMSFYSTRNPRIALSKARAAVAEKTEAMNHARSRLKAGKRLTDLEIEELLGFDFIIGPDSVEEQVRRYYLQLKDTNPARAKQMVTETDAILSNPQTLDTIKELCCTLGKYWSGFLIRYQGKHYTFQQDSVQEV